MLGLVCVLARLGLLTHTRLRCFRPQAIEKGNHEGAKIYAENTIRKKQEALQMLQ